jgi:L-2-hydroxyglutarate oxidase LhgO
LSERVECIVVGAGVIGLAIARELAARSHEVVILEKQAAIGMGISSRNSEVIHGGIYYPKDSLKARLCVEGRHLLYEYCSDHGIPHKRLGKLIVAVTEAELEGLEDVRGAAHQNGVSDVDYLTLDAVRELEPEVRCAGALLSPSTGIVDSHSLMLALQGDAQERGAMIAFHSHLIECETINDGFELAIECRDASSSGETLKLRCDMLVNAAGLGAQEVANRISGISPDNIPPLYLARGCYFTMAGHSPFQHLIYPMPDHESLGVHVTLDIAGHTRFGPDVEWIDAINYDVNPSRENTFYKAVRRYYPALRDGSLQPGYSGIRPKIQAPGEPAADFVIDGPGNHGIPGLVNLFGIESPGLTATLGISDYVIQLLDS